jgi:hypothetical protein
MAAVYGYNGRPPNPMPAQYLDEFIRELRRDGDAAFRARHAGPVIIVTQAAGESKDEGASTTVSAETSGWRIQQVSLLNRVFAVSRGAFEKDAPVVVGRSRKQADIVIPDDSVSKRHCQFETRRGAVSVADCGSTNGTTIGDAELEVGKTYPLKGGETIGAGNFTFLYLTPDGFLGYLKKVVKL